MTLGGTLILVLLFWLLGFLIFESARAWVSKLPNPTEARVISYFRAVPLAELAEILNLADEGALRLNLPARQFRKEQLNRLRLVREYYARIEHNIAILQQWCNLEHRKSWKTRNHDVNSASRELDELCVQMRLALFVAHIKLNLWLVRIVTLPFLPVPFLAEIRAIGHCDVLYSYEQIKIVAQKLSRACGGRSDVRLAESL